MFLRAGSSVGSRVGMRVPALLASPHFAVHGNTTAQQQCRAVPAPPRSTVVARFYAENGAPSPSLEPEVDDNVRLFASFGVYKGKAAMQTRIIEPTWEPVVSKNASANSNGAPAVKSEQLTREGVLFLEFANVNANVGTRPGERTYNWQQKGTIALKAVELGRIFSSPFTGPDAKVELFHDATKAGAKTDTTKSLKVSQNPDGTYAFQLTVRDNQNQSRNYYVPLDRGEFYVMQKIADRAIPNLLGLMP